MREEFLAKVIASSVTGINYWAEVTEYRYTGSLLTNICIRDVIDEAKPTYRVNTKTIEKGVEKIRQSALNMDEATLTTILVSDTKNDFSTLQKEHADLIVQAGVFGELKYTLV